MPLPPSKLNGWVFFVCLFWVFFCFKGGNLVNWTCFEHETHAQWFYKIHFIIFVLCSSCLQIGERAPSWKTAADKRSKVCSIIWGLKELNKNTLFLHPSSESAQKEVKVRQTGVQRITLPSDERDNRAWHVSSADELPPGTPDSGQVTRPSQPELSSAVAEFPQV